MRTSVAIALLVLGTFLVVAPLVLDLLEATMAQPTSEDTRIVIHARPDRVYRLTCLCVGIVMIFLAVAGSFDARRNGKENVVVEEEREQGRFTYF